MLSSDAMDAPTLAAAVGTIDRISRAFWSLETLVSVRGVEPDCDLVSGGGRPSSRHTTLRIGSWHSTAEDSETVRLFDDIVTFIMQPGTRSSTHRPVLAASQRPANRCWFGQAIEAGFLRALVSYFAGYDPLSNKNLSFLCALLHYDYRAEKYDLLYRQVVFLRPNPSEPFIVLLDYEVAAERLKSTR
ncbi:hypothetical protein DFH07DRAFT_965687 [Mycena maculata]|uniref:Uncharacterized protein n=1 Tax=Mycena maculata TaxID=230809 RepID=A0AAD7N003_9AGAR|nr:hypothetical protein DFH07DRAFT_965687 [Mycena maculata]